MNNRFYVLIMAALLLSITACATTDGTGETTKYSMVDVQTARSMHDSGAVFIDVRTVSSFDDGHIPGAYNIPISSLTASSLGKVADKGQDVVFYCYGISCDYSNKASSKARYWGYQNVFYFMKGYPAWLDAGYPVETS